MEGRARKAGIAIGALLVAAAVVYIFVTPYNRTPGIRLGGTMTAAPSDWTTIESLANATLPWEVFL